MNHPNQSQYIYSNNPTPKTYLLHKLSRERLQSTFTEGPVKSFNEQEREKLKQFQIWPAQQRFVNSVRPVIVQSSFPWTPEEDLYLYKLVLQFGSGGCWEKVSFNMGNGRSPQDCWNRWLVVKDRIEKNGNSEQSFSIFNNNINTINETETISPNTSFHHDNNKSFELLEKYDYETEREDVEMEDKIDTKMEISNNEKSRKTDVVIIKNDSEKQEICCIDGCENEVQNRSRFSLRREYLFKKKFLETNWNRVCTKHYFSDLYIHKKKSKKK